MPRCKHSFLPSLIHSPAYTPAPRPPRPPLQPGLHRPPPPSRLHRPPLTFTVLDVGCITDQVLQIHPLAPSPFPPLTFTVLSLSVSPLGSHFTGASPTRYSHSACLPSTVLPRRRRSTKGEGEGVGSNLIVNTPTPCKPAADPQHIQGRRTGQQNS